MVSSGGRSDVVSVNAERPLARPNPTVAPAPIVASVIAGPAASAPDASTTR